jgi:phage terminase large subunit
MIYLIFMFAQQPDKIITIVSESRPHLDIGVIRIMNQLLLKSHLIKKCEYNISQSRLIFNNGTILEFFSADRIEKALGARRNMLFGNEINSLKFNIWEELARRSHYVLADFNPTSIFWLEKWLEYQEKYAVIKTNYKNNPFLPEHEKRKILKQAEVDANFKRVHIDCEYGIYEGLIFTEWVQVDEMPVGEPVYGLDFGYTNDPTALVKVIAKGDDLFVDEMVYRTGLTNNDIARLLKQVNVEHEIYADSSEPKSIEEIYQRGFNIKPSIKGQGSVNAGIDKLMSYNLKITKRSVNLIKELRNYAWVTDKNGEPTNKPIDAFNHAIDALRYSIYKKKKVENWIL